jgi:hypothetical protein
MAPQVHGVMQYPDDIDDLSPIDIACLKADEVSTMAPFSLYMKHIQIQINIVT